MHFVLSKHLAIALVASCVSDVVAASSPIKLIQKRDIVIVTQEILKVVGYTSTVWVQPPPPPPPPSPSAKVESSIPEEAVTEQPTQAPSPVPIVNVPEVEPQPEPQPEPEPEPVEEPVEEPPTSSGGGGGGGYVSGKATFYDAGMGSCGETHSNSDMVCALSKATMSLTSGPNPNLNPMCGTKIRVKSASNSNGIIVTIVDTCPGCHGPNDLDLSPAAFDQLGDQAAGVIDITWERL